MRTSDSALGITLVSLSSVFFGTISIFAALLSRAHVGPWLQVLSRFLISAIVFAVGYALVCRQPPPLPTRRQAVYPVLNGALLLFAFATYILSVAMGTPPSKLVVIGFLFPLWATLLGALLLGEKLTRRKLLALAVGFTGIAFTLEIWRVESLRNLQLSDFFALCNSIATGFILVSGRWIRSRANIPSLHLSLWSFTVAVGLIALLALLDGLLNGGAGVAAQFSFDAAAVGPWIGLLAIALLSTAIPYGLMYAGLGRVPSSLAAILLMPEVITVFALSGLFLGQPVGVYQVIGAAIIIAAGAMVAR
ncbi:MAG: EamA family transporter [Anaerolineae bacterium]|nr:EamA family transporter [Anaerolineae bacterium]